MAEENAEAELPREVAQIGALFSGWPLYLILRMRQKEDGTLRVPVLQRRQWERLSFWDNFVSKFDNL